MIWCVDWRQDADLTDNNDEEEANYWYDDDYDNNDADEHKDITYITITMHYGIRAMGAMTLRISDLCLSFSPHPNISDGNFNLVHHFFACKYFR